MIPRFWNDFEAWSFASVSTALVDPGVGDGSGDGRGEGSFAGLDFICVDVVCFNRFDGVSSSLILILSAFLFMIGDMLSRLERLLQKLWVLTTSPTFRR